LYNDCVCESLVHPPADIIWICQIIISKAWFTHQRILFEFVK
jgi:hypothetical protein